MVYGGAGGSRALSVSPRRITEIVRSPRGVNTILALSVEGDLDAEQVMIHDYQLHPLDHSVLHADFVRVDLERESEWQVPVHLEGESVGVKRGGNLDFVSRTLAVSCLPHDIPERLPLSIADLDYGDTVRAGQIELPGSLVLATAPEVVVVQVSAPKVSAEAPEDSEEAAVAGETPEETAAE